MWKKLMASFFIGTSLLLLGGNAHAAVKDPVKIDQTKLVNEIKTQNVKTIEKNSKELEYEIINPEKLSYSTDEKIALINGKAPAKSKIIIKVLGTTDLSKKTFNLEKLPEEKDYIEISKEDLIVGNLGIFQKKLDLVMGINKILVDFNTENVENVEIIVYVYEKAPSISEVMTISK